MTSISGRCQPDNIHKTEYDCTSKLRIFQIVSYIYNLTWIVTKRLYLVRTYLLMQTILTPISIHSRTCDVDSDAVCPKDTPILCPNG